ncbi:MAG: GH116 family glycosyl hydrolase [Bacteroidota bacterium]
MKKDPQMGKYYLHFLLLFVLTTITFSQQKYYIGYVTSANEITKEDEAAIEWLNNSNIFSCKIIKAEEGNWDFEGMNALWIHLPDTIGLNNLLKQKRFLSYINKYYQNGGKILFSDYAAILPNAIGIEPKKPEIRRDTVQNEWLFDERGFQGHLGHPLFAGFFGGVYVWDANEDQIMPLVGYFGNDFPERGKVIAVDKAYVFVYAERKIVIEHSNKKGKIISIGSSIYFSKSNNLRNHLELFMKNTLRYLTGEKFSESVTYWEKFNNHPILFTEKNAPIVSSKEREMKNIPSSELVFTRLEPQNNYYEASGRRALIMGKENGGIEEVWVHPLRILRDYEVGMITGDSITWLQNYPVRVEIRPESFSRIYSTPFGVLKEIIFASLWKAGGIAHYTSTFRVRLVIRFRSDLRWVWPYDANALGDVHYAYDETMNALHLKDTTGKFYCLFGGDVIPSAKISGQFQKIQWSPKGFVGAETNENQVYHAVMYDLNNKNNFTLNYAFLGTNEGKEKALSDYRILLEKPEEQYAEQVAHTTDLLKRTVQIFSPDKEFNTLFRWAIVGTDKFLAYTPGLGTGLLAGFATSAHGWNGTHKNSGRPGYAWYFGRDSEWSGFAIDDYGDTEIVKEQLKFLQRYQDRSGKIFHEISTSGVVHYDAADATPLYIILAGHYLRASGDIQFIKESWTHLKKATDFLYSTDTDGDGLIENTNVGHGWVEGGALFGAHSSFYLSSTWGQALKDMSYFATLIGEKDLAVKYSLQSKKVQKILNTDFWNDSTQFYNLGKLKDGTYQTEPTILPAVGAYFNLLEDTKVKHMLDSYAANSFSTDWGVRILSSSSKLFNPTGYHYGAVWPLFTGWAALAEYEYGNSVQAFSHFNENLAIKNYWALGYVEEVMNGLVYKPSGVCQHQCWSETNILHPAITGMIGWKPNAVEQSAMLKPRFPLSWDTISVANLRSGKSLLQLTMKREINKTVYFIKLMEGPEIKVQFAPEIPEGMKFKKTFIDKKEIAIKDSTFRGLLATPLQIQLNTSVEIVFEHTGGIGMYPVVPHPQPGDSSQGFRIISTFLSGKQYTLIVEGKSGYEGNFILNTFDQKVVTVTNAEYETTPKQGIINLHVKFDDPTKQFGCKTVKVVLQ